MGTKQGVRAQDPSPGSLPPTSRDPGWFQGLGLEKAGVPQGHLRMDVPGSVEEGGLWGLAEGRMTQGRGVLVIYPRAPTWAQSFACSHTYTLKALFATTRQ